MLFSTEPPSLIGYCTPGPCLFKLCVFSQKIKQRWTKYPMDLIKNVPMNSKITAFISVETLVVKVLKTMFENQYF